MTNASDALIKQEILDKFENINNFKLRIFPSSSNQDQKLFKNGGLTFVSEGIAYGSCDAALINNNITIAIEGSDCLNRRSSGSAQYQRFHHALGAVRNGHIGIYYLRKGDHAIRGDLYGMAVNASKVEKGFYLITQDLNQILDLVNNFEDENKKNIIISNWIDQMKRKFNEFFNKNYKNLDHFANKRSTVIKDKYILKFQSNAIRSFTTSEGRGGHLSLGEIYLTKYIFEEILNFKKKLYFLFPRMSKNDLIYLDEHKSSDKEWILHRKEKNVYIKSHDDLNGVDKKSLKNLKLVSASVLKNGSAARKIYNNSMQKIITQLKNNTITIN